MKTARALAAGVCAVSVAFAVAACGDTGTTSTGAPTTTVDDTTVDDTTAPGRADVLFAQMMIPHHAQALEMSGIVLAKDGIPEPVGALAAQIEAAQGPEIEQLTAWLDQWGEPSMPDMHTGPDHHAPGTEPMPGSERMPGAGHMQGMLSSDDLQALTDAEGAEAARLFLTQMIAHHEGAVTMAEAEIADGRHPAAVQLARTIVETQQQEIDTMQQLLATL